MNTSCPRHGMRGPHTEAAPATPTEMPPLPPDAIDAAPALVVFTEDSWPRVRFAPTLGPLVPTERPLVDTNLPLPWNQPGLLQGDDDPDDEVEKGLPRRSFIQGLTART